MALCLAAGCSTAGLTTQYYRNYEINVEQRSETGASMVYIEDIAYEELQQWVGFENSKDGWQYFKNVTEDSFKQEMIYEGRSGSTVHFTFKEYNKEDFSIPAASWDLEHDLDKSDVFKFRNYRIRILEAEDEYIKFLVLSE